MRPIKPAGYETTRAMIQAKQKPMGQGRAHNSEIPPNKIKMQHLRGSVTTRAKKLRVTLPAMPWDK